MKHCYSFNGDVLKIVVLAISCVLSATTALAQSESSDTVKTQELKEVVIEGRSQRVIDNGVEFIPSKRVKKMAIDAFHILSLMNVPQLDVTPGSTKIKTFSGQDVVLFIDYVLASDEDLQGIRTEDIVKIEVLKYPGDPRFQGYANVVNFIMRKYEWGGYTKITANGAVISKDEVSGLLYSVLSMKNWRLDANVSGAMTHEDNGAVYEKSTFRDIFIGNEHYDEISRTERSGEDFLKQTNSQSASLRAMYTTNSSQMIHLISFYRSGNPHTYCKSNVAYSDNLFTSSSSEDKLSGQTISPSVSGDYYFKLSDKDVIQASWKFAYGSIRRNSVYQVDLMPSIVNINRESSFVPNANFAYARNFSHNNSLTTSLITYNSIFNTEYSGSYAGVQKMLSSENLLLLEYRQSWQCGLHMFSRLGASYVHSRLNGENILRQWNPRLGMQLHYNIDSRNMVSLEGWWGNNHPSPSICNTALVQSNELLWLQGNPDLRNTTFVTAIASYIFLPTNKLNMAASMDYYGYLDKVTDQYYDLAGHDGLVRKKINSGDFHRLAANISANLKLLNNSLSLRAVCKYIFCKSTGIDAQTLNCVSANFQANYYFKNFSFMLYYSTPFQSLPWYAGGMRLGYKSKYGLMINYAVGDFKAGLTLHNVFARDFKCYYDFDSERYSMHGWNVSSDNPGRTIELTLSYTLPYGKKINRNFELNTGSATESAILK